MKVRSGSGPIDRDWFGLDAFLPGPRFTREGGLLYLLDEVGSTNDFLRGRGNGATGRLCRWDGWGWVAQSRSRLAPVQHISPGTVVVARRQTAGHGTLGRSWQDCGGLNLSVAVPRRRIAFSRGFSVWLGLIAVLVLREGERLDARLKWPNDIVVGRQKLGGILIEHGTSGGETQVVAGLGLNLTTARQDFPLSIRESATSLALEGGRVPRLGEFCARLLSRVEQDLDRFSEEGWAPYRPALSLLDSLLGQSVRLAANRGEITGRAVGIDDDGGLLVECALADGTKTTESYRTGDVQIIALATDGVGVDADARSDR